MQPILNECDTESGFSTSDVPKDVNDKNKSPPSSYQTHLVDETNEKIIDQVNDKIETFKTTEDEAIKSNNIPITSNNEKITVSQDTLKEDEKKDEFIVTNNDGEKKEQVSDQECIVEEVDKTVEKPSPSHNEETYDTLISEITAVGMDSTDLDVEKKRHVHSATEHREISKTSLIDPLQNSHVQFEQSAIFTSKLGNNRKRKNVQINMYHNTIPGVVYVIGQGDMGQLGLGSSITQCNLPTKVNNIKIKFKQISCGGLHTLALSTEGLVYSCGCNDEGALGRNTSGDNEFQLMRVEIPKNVRITKVTAGDSHSAALTVGGKVYAWGAFRDTNGPVGLKSQKYILQKPIQIYTDPDICVDISSGSNHILLLTQSGRIFSCGTGDEGQLGRVPERRALARGGRRGSTQLTIPEQVFFSRRRNFHKNNSVVQISTGRFNSFAHFNDGTIFGWGLNDYHQFGEKFENDRIFFPVHLKTLQDQCEQPDNENVLQIVGGVQHTLVLNTKTNKIYSMGDSHDGRLGIGKKDPNQVLKDEEENDSFIHEVVLPHNVSPITHLACGDACSFFVNRHSNLYSWGVGCNNQLGFHNDGDVFSPTLISHSSLPVDRIVQVSSGAQHTVILCVE